MNPNPAGNEQSGPKKFFNGVMKLLNGFFNSGMTIEKPSKAQQPSEPMKENAQNQGGFAPQDGYAPQQSGYAPQQSGFAPQQSGFAPQQSGFAPQQSGFAPQQSGYAPQQSGYAPQQNSFAPQQSGYAPQQNSFAPQTPNAFAPQSQSSFAPPQSGFVPPPQSGPPPVTYAKDGGNITYIHNETQQTFSHVARILHINKRIECRTAIAYMQSDESVLLNMEGITDEAEIKRCVDILYGAAFAMGARLAKVCEHGVYMISPPSLRLISDKPTNVQQRDAARGRYTPISSARQGSRFEDVAAYTPAPDLRTYSEVTPIEDGYVRADARQAF